MNDVISRCIEETGKELILNNQDIVKYLCNIEEERHNLEIIIQKQYQERKQIEAEIEKLTYKLCLINKSLSMRIKAKNNYDRTIDEIRSHYEKLVDSSTTLKKIVEKTQQELDDIMNKRTGTGAGPNGEEVQMLYVKSNNRDPDECPCVYIAEAPTKEYDSSAKAPPPSSPPSRLSEDSNNRDSTDPDSFRFRSPLESGIGNPYTMDGTRTPTETEARSISNNIIPYNQAKTNRSNQRPSDEQLEVEMALVTPDNETSKMYPFEIHSEHTSEPSLPVLNLDNHSGASDNIDGLSQEMSKLKAPEDLSTNVLLSRLKKSLHKMSESANVKRRPESKLVKPQGSVNTQLSSISAASTSTTEQKMEKRSVSDVLKATSGLR